MVRFMQPQDLDRVMEIWLEGNLAAHSFIEADYWKRKFETVKSMLPEAEIYVYESENQIKGFIGLDAGYIAGLFVADGNRRQGIGRRLLETVKKKNCLSAHVYARNEAAAAFYQAEGFHIENQTIDEETGEKEYWMTYSSTEVC